MRYPQLVKDIGRQSALQSYLTAWDIARAIKSLQQKRLTRSNLPLLDQRALLCEIRADIAAAACAAPPATPPHLRTSPRAADAAIDMSDQYRYTRRNRRTPEDFGRMLALGARSSSSCSSPGAVVEAVVDVSTSSRSWSRSDITDDAGALPVINRRILATVTEYYDDGVGVPSISGL